MTASADQPAASSRRYVLLVVCFFALLLAVLLAQASLGFEPSPWLNMGDTPVALERVTG